MGSPNHSCSGDTHQKNTARHSTPLFLWGFDSVRKVGVSPTLGILDTTELGVGFGYYSAVVLHRGSISAVVETGAVKVLREYVCIRLRLEWIAAVVAWCWYA